jgi:hypothetical protein
MAGITAHQNWNLSASFAARVIVVYRTGLAVAV